MSVTFFPKVNYKNNSQNLVWQANYVAHTHHIPKNIQNIINQYEDFDYFLYQQDFQPFSYWETLLKKMNMKLYEDYPNKKIYVDNIPYNCAIILHGELINNTHKDITLSNTNANALCQLLGIDTVGSIHPLALLKKIESVNLKNITEFTRDTTDTQSHIGPRMISFGLSEDKIKDYLSRLEELCEYCIKQEYDITWG